MDDYYTCSPTWRREQETLWYDYNNINTEKDDTEKDDSIESVRKLFKIRIKRKICHCNPYCWDLAPDPSSIPMPPLKWLKTNKNK